MDDEMAAWHQRYAVWNAEGEAIEAEMRRMVHEALMQGGEGRETAKRLLGVWRRVLEDDARRIAGELKKIDEALATPISV